MLSPEKVFELKKKSIEIRMKCLEQIATIGRGHVGGSFSICELMACLYFEILNVDPSNPHWEDRDRFVMSKGHAGPAMYAALALKGYFPESELKTLNQPETKLPSHTDMTLTPGVDMTTGSLGQGISSGLGIALANKLKGRNNYTYILLGDGECDEGQVWEAALFAGAHKMSNVIVFIDYNGKQLDGTIDEVLPLGDLGEKFRSFGWYVLEVEDGHDVEAICAAVNAAKLQKSKPTAIILHTIKGKGCSFSEKAEANHNMVITQEDYEKAMEELKCQLDSLCNDKCKGS